MIKYVALLGGINVGSHRLKMSELKQYFEELNLKNVRSYISSGNIFFESESKDKNRLSLELQEQLKSRLGYEVPVFLKTLDELRRLLKDAPFNNMELDSSKRSCVLFTNIQLSRMSNFPIVSSKNDMEIVAVDGTEAFLVWHIINGRPPSGVFGKDVLPSNNTLRFYHTLQKIYSAADTQIIS